MAASVELQQQVDALKLFLANAPSNWDPEDTIRRFLLPNGEYICCVLWKNLFHVTGTDIVRALIFRFQAFGRPIRNMKKFEEGVFSDLRNLKPGQDATLEGPRSEFLELLYKNNCIRTQKKQKVFYWFSVPHERLFTDALERDLKRESLGQEPITVAVSAEEASAGLLPATLVSSARRTTTPLPTPSNVPSYISGPSVLNTPIMNSVMASMPLGTHGSPWSEPIPDPLDSTSDEWMADAMDDWIADDAPLALNEDMHRIGRSASWNDDMMHKPAYAQQSEESSISSQPLLSPTFSDASSFQTQYFNFGEKIPRSNSSLSSLLSLDQGYGSFDDTNKIKHPQDASKHLQSSPTISVQHVNHVLSNFDFTPTHIDPSILSKKAAGGHPRAHSLSHNITASSSVSSNPLFGKYSMFDNSPNYKHRRRSSLLSADNSSHRRSYSSASETTSKESSPVPGMDGESRVERRSWNCDFDNCGRMFKRYEHLKRHYRTHTKERPYVCDFKGCGKPFSRSDNLAQHIRIHQKSCKSEEDAICVKIEGDEMQDSDGSPDPEEMEGWTNETFLDTRDAKVITEAL